MSTKVDAATKVCVCVVMQLFAKLFWTVVRHELERCVVS